MRVITLDHTDFSVQCRQLAKIAISTQRYDAIVGIASGGIYVAREIALSLPEATLYTVTLRRPSTRRKGKMFKRLIRLLPTYLLDQLRIIESRILAASSAPAVSHEVHIPEALSSAKRILVVDDAIDSGRTMNAVVNTIRQRCPQATVKTAVITVTTPTPVIHPDFTIYKDGSLVRFPWSADFK